MGRKDDKFGTYVIRLVEQGCILPALKYGSYYDLFLYYYYYFILFCEESVTVWYKFGHSELFDNRIVLIQ